MHDVLLKAMKEFPDKQELLLSIAEKKCTVTDLEYAKKHLPDLKALIFCMDKSIRKRISNVDVGYFDEEYCSKIRDIYGPYHDVTKTIEKELPSLSELVQTGSDREVYTMYDYMCGTVEGSREAVRIMTDAGFFGRSLKCEEMCFGSWLCDTCYLIKGINSGDMLEKAIRYGGDLEFIYRIAERIEPKNLDNSLHNSIIFLPDEHELHRIILEKQRSWKY